MLTHSFIWTAIDALAARNGFSTSGLAKRAGLDATTFNKSKRFTPEGKQRWPSTESVSRILSVTSTTMTDFIAMGEQALANGGVQSPQFYRAAQAGIPIIPIDKMHMTGAFDLDGYPIGDGWKMLDTSDFQTSGRQRVYGVRVTGDDYAPIYRADDILLCQPFVKLKDGMRALLLRRDGTLMLADIRDAKGDKITFAPLNALDQTKTAMLSDFALTAQIKWVSQ